MRKKIIKGLLILFAGFALLFGLRLIYGYLVYSDSESSQDYYYNNSNNDGQIRNIASSKYEKTGKEKEIYNAYQSPPQEKASDQKYEKIASLSSSSKEFEKTEQQARSIIKKYNGLIQYEQKSGLPGNLYLSMVIGIPPQNFDSTVEELKSIGKLNSINIDKIDKTNEYRELNARKTSLEKTIQSLYGLQQKGGQIDEYINLENRILEVQQELQTLGVTLGEFDQENEFCTVKYSLNESTATNGIPFSQRVKVAFEWTLTYYSLLVMIFAFGVLLIFLSIKTAQALKWIPSAPKTDDKSK